MQLTITVIIIIITVLVSLGAFNNEKLQSELIFYPPAVTNNKQWYRFFTCGFIHADFGHLLFNMISLYFFGPAVEKAFEQIFGENGNLLYLLLYVSALMVSLLPTYFKNINNHQYRSLGASGAVSAVIFAGLMLAPGTEVYIFFIPIPIPGFIFAPLYVLVSAILDKKGGDNINHSAHIWGGLYGMVFVIVACYFVQYNAVNEAIEKIKTYMQVKGWTT